MCNKKCNIFAIIGIITAVAAAMAGVAYFVYRFMNERKCFSDGDCYEYDCDNCECEDCDNCPELDGEDSAEEKDEADDKTEE